MRARRGGENPCPPSLIVIVHLVSLMATATVNVSPAAWRMALLQASAAASTICSRSSPVTPAERSAWPTTARTAGTAAGSRRNRVLVRTSIAARPTLRLGATNPQVAGAVGAVPPPIGARRTHRRPEVVVSKAHPIDRPRTQERHGPTTTGAADGARRAKFGATGTTRRRRRRSRGRALDRRHGGSPHRGQRAGGSSRRRG